MPNVGMMRLLRSIRKARNSVARDRLLACCYLEEGWGIRRICKMMARPYSTVRDWLWRMRERGFRGRHDKKRGRRKCKIPGAVFKEVRRWLKKEPSNFGVESGSSQYFSNFSTLANDPVVSCLVLFLPGVTILDGRKERPCSHSSDLEAAPDTTPNAVPGGRVLETGIVDLRAPESHRVEFQYVLVRRSPPEYHARARVRKVPARAVFSDSLEVIEGDVPARRNQL